MAPKCLNLAYWVSGHQRHFLLCGQNKSTLTCPQKTIRGAGALGFSGGAGDFGSSATEVRGLPIVRNRLNIRRYGRESRGMGRVSSALGGSGVGAGNGFDPPKTSLGRRRFTPDSKFIQVNTPYRLMPRPPNLHRARRRQVLECAIIARPGKRHHSEPRWVASAHCLPHGSRLPIWVALKTFPASGLRMPSKFGFGFGAHVPLLVES